MLIEIRDCDAFELDAITMIEPLSKQVRKRGELRDQWGLCLYLGPSQQVSFWYDTKEMRHTVFNWFVAARGDEIDDRQAARAFLTQHFKEERHD